MAESGRSGGRSSSDRGRRGAPARASGSGSSRGSLNRAGSGPGSSGRSDRGRDQAGDPRRSGRVARPAPVARAGQSSAPALPGGLDLSDLDPAIRSQLRSLDKPVADAIAGHLLMTAELLDEDPARAFRHAAAARDLGARIGAVREAAGIAAYRAGEWAQARTELRTARRITGDARHLPLLADCERALGKPELAVKLLDDPDAAGLEPAARAELLIVVASARRDMGQAAAALLLLQRRGADWLDRRRPSEAALRVWFVYADLLVELGRRDEAAEWFAAIARHDADDELGAREYAAELGLRVS